jgi:hypothetical protein
MLLLASCIAIHDELATIAFLEVIARLPTSGAL